MQATHVAMSSSDRRRAKFCGNLTAHVQRKQSMPTLTQDEVPWTHSVLVDFYVVVFPADARKPFPLPSYGERPCFLSCVQTLGILKKRESPNLLPSVSLSTATWCGSTLSCTTPYWHCKFRCHQNQTNIAPGAAARARMSAVKDPKMATYPLSTARNPHINRRWILPIGKSEREIKSK